MKNCPVEIGDTFYRSVSTTGIDIPDRLEVLDVFEKDGMMLIRAKYLYHTVGPVFERTFSATIFDDPRWVIEKRKEKTA